jgi:hypothetical protein
VDTPSQAKPIPICCSCPSTSSKRHHESCISHSHCLYSKSCSRKSVFSLPAPPPLDIMLYAILSLLTIASGSPTLHARDTANCSATFGVPGNVYICDTPGFQPPSACRWFSGGSCYDLKAGGWPGSIGPDPGGRCMFYLKKGCASRGLHFTANNHWVE